MGTRSAAGSSVNGYMRSRKGARGCDIGVTNEGGRQRKVMHDMVLHVFQCGSGLSLWVRPVRGAIPAAGGVRHVLF